MPTVRKTWTRHSIKSTKRYIVRKEINFISKTILSKLKEKILQRNGEINELYREMHQIKKLELWNKTWGNGKNYQSSEEVIKDTECEHEIDEHKCNKMAIKKI